MTTSLCRRALASITSEGEGGNEEEKYQQLQGWVSNLMVVGTLLLGFNVGGTILSVSMTGEENYGFKQLISFVTESNIGMVVTFLSIVISFFVQARGTDHYYRLGSKSAYRAMRKSLIWIAVAEFLVYVSLMGFIGSLKSYVLMNLAGPRTCPNDSWEDQAECSLLGGELFEVAKAVCDTNFSKATDKHSCSHIYKPYSSRSDNCTHLCTYTTIYLNRTSYHRDDEPWSDLFGWSLDQYEHVPDLKAFASSYAPETMRDRANWIAYANYINVMKDLAILKCKVIQVGGMQDKLCGDSWKTGDCARAYVASQSADACVSSLKADAEKCRKVCSASFESVNAADPKLAMITAARIVDISSIIVLILAILRMIRVGVQSCVNLSQDIRVDGYTGAFMEDVLDVRIEQDKAEIEGGQRLERPAREEQA